MRLADGVSKGTSKYTDMIAANFLDSAVGAGGELQIAEGAQMFHLLLQSADPGGDMAADVERGDPSEVSFQDSYRGLPTDSSKSKLSTDLCIWFRFFLKQSGAGEQGQGDFGNPPGGDMEHPDHGGVAAS